ncbi:BMP family ABC transporter substrate-binding protein, partial [Streptococcus pyogenes]
TMVVALGTAFISGSALADIKVGLVLDRGGKDDKSFNAAAFAGASRAAKELGIELKVVEATDNNAFEPPLRAFAQRKYDLI